jgi:hypothetical protein
LVQIATLTLMVVASRCTDHRLSLIGTKVKQLGFAPAQAVQKPVGLSFHVPDVAALPAALVFAALVFAALVLAALSAAAFRGSRKALPSGVKVILNLAPVGEAAVNGWPLKNVALMSAGFIASAARAAVDAKPKAKMAIRKRIVPPGESIRGT